MRCAVEVRDRPELFRVVVRIDRGFETTGVEPWTHLPSPGRGRFLPFLAFLVYGFVKYVIQVTTFPFGTLLKAHLANIRSTSGLPKLDPFSLYVGGIG